MFLKIPLRFAFVFLLLLNILGIVFHVLVIFGFFPDDIVWGGKIKSKNELLIFESVAICINLFFSTTIVLYAKYIESKISIKLLKAILWLFTLLFTLNTIGNVMAETTLESRIFTPLTFVSALLCLRILLDPTEEKTVSN
jgi:hypothetical protein